MGSSQCPTLYKSPVIPLVSTTRIIPQNNHDNISNALFKAKTHTGEMLHSFIFIRLALTLDIYYRDK